MPTNQKIFAWVRKHWIPLLLGSGYAVAFSILSILRHSTFHTQTWDLGVFEQSFWYTLLGRPMFNVFENANHLSVHFSPFLFLLVPFYAVTPGPAVLLILQAIALGSGALPLYRIAARRISPRAAVVVTIAYVLYPALHWLNLFDFHEVAFAVPAFLWAFDWLETKRWWWSATALVVAASTAENMILATAGVGLYLLVTLRAHRKFGAGVLIVSLVYFVIVAKLFMPTLGGKIYRLDRYTNLGATPSAIAQTVVGNPGLVLQTVMQEDKLKYLARLGAPLAFLTLFTPATWLLLMPGLAQNLLTNYAPQFDSSYQYDAILIPFLFIGLVSGWRALTRRFPRPTRWLGLAAISASVAGFLWWSPLGLRLYPWQQFRPNERSATLQKIVAQIPPNARVAAMTNLVPHLTHRDGIWLIGSEPMGGADVVVIDLWDATGFETAEQMQKYLSLYVGNDAYQKTVIRQRWLWLRRKDTPMPPSILPP